MSERHLAGTIAAAEVLTGLPYHDRDSTVNMGGGEKTCRDVAELIERHTQVRALVKDAEAVVELWPTNKLAAAVRRLDWQIKQMRRPAAPAERR